MKNVLNKIKHLTLFDKLVFAFVAMVIVFFTFTFFRKTTYITLTIKVGEDTVSWPHWSRAWFSQLFHEGMKEKDGLGTVNAEVLKVRSYDIWPAKKAVYLTTRVKVVYSRSSDQNTYKGLPVLIGATIKMYLDKVLVDGLVTNIEGVIDSRERKTILVEAQIKEESPTFPETSGTKQYIADAINIGQKILDDQGNVIIEITGKRVEDAKRNIFTDDGRALIGINPLRKDVYLTLKLESIKLQNRYYLFDDIPILIGQTIPINLSTISVFPEITKIIN